MSFQTTRWSRILAARDAGLDGPNPALDELCAAYWSPVYAYVRRQGATPEEAKDLTQGVFTDLLQRSFLDQLDPDRGRFRSFLLAATKHYLANQRARERTLKRGGAAITLSLDVDDAEARYQAHLATDTTPERTYERSWAENVLQRAMDRLAEQTARRQGEQFFAVLKPLLTGTAETPAYAEIARRVGMSEGAVKTAVYRMRKRYGALLRDEISSTVTDQGQVDDELRRLLSVLAAT